MTKLKVVPLVLALSALSAPAQGQALELKVGQAEAPGTVGLLLTHGDATLAVSVELAAMTATEKAAALVDAVAAQAGDGAWRAQADATRLTFQHLVDGAWLEVDAVKDVSDTTGGGTQLASTGALAAFSLSLLEDALASGLDVDLKPAFVTVAVTDTLSWTHPVQAGETPQQVIDQFVAFLQEQAGTGVEVTRSSPTSVTLRLDYAVSSLNWQVTDTGLLPKVGGERDAGVIER
jgi:hypothetical protein